MKNSNLLELESHPVGALMWRYFWPAFIGVMANSLYNIIDRIFIGQYDGFWNAYRCGSKCPVISESGTKEL